MVEAALEVARPSYTRIVLKNFFNAALTNNNQSPHYGIASKDFSAWYAREAAIGEMLASMDARLAAECTDEIAQMYTNRRLQEHILQRGPTWSVHVPYMEAARKPEGADLDLPRALLALYVYSVQLEAWANGYISGDKSEIRAHVRGLEHEFKAQFAKEFGVALMQS